MVVLRIIQPARIQDIHAAYIEMWSPNDEEAVHELIDVVFDKLKNEKLLIQLRKGSYILNSKGMEIATRYIKEREVDNRRMFLMKKQRRGYN